jgi:hypothetical protein
MERRKLAHLPHGRVLGALIGVAVCLAAVLVIDQVAPGRQDGIFSLPAAIVTAVFAGAMGGILFASILIGGREDDRASRAARESLAHERNLRHWGFHQDSRRVAPGWTRPLS